MVTYPKKQNRSAVARAGLNYVRSVVEEANCVFIEIHAENDFGNDAIVELVDGETARGRMLGLQIKSGKSYRLKNGYVIPASRAQVNYWRAHTLPVVGVVYDPELKTAHWIDITRYVDKRWFDEADSNRLRVHTAEYCRFDVAGFRDFFLPIFLSKPVILDYERSVSLSRSFEPTEHRIGVASLIYGHRARRDAWDLLLGLFRDREVHALDSFVVYALALAPGHPDIFWGPYNRLDPEVRAYVKGCLARADAAFVMKLLAFVDQRGFGRGTIGQNVEAVIHCVDGKIEMLANFIADGDLDLDVRLAALWLFAYYQQGASIPTLLALARGRGALAKEASILSDILRHDGYVALD